MEGGRRRDGGREDGESVAFFRVRSQCQEPWAWAWAWVVPAVRPSVHTQCARPTHGCVLTRPGFSCDFKAVVPAEAKSSGAVGAVKSSTVNLQLRRQPASMELEARCGVGHRSAAVALRATSLA